MVYTVVSPPEANNELAAIWNLAPDRAAVSAASNHIDDALRNRAERVGTPFGDCRVLVVPPLAVEFTVSPDDCLVTIIRYLRVS